MASEDPWHARGAGSGCLAGCGCIGRGQGDALSPELSSNTLPNKLGDCLAAGASGGIDRAGEVGLDLEPEHCVASE